MILADRAPLTDGHLLVVTSEHVESSADLPRSAQVQFRRFVRRACRIAQTISGRIAVAIEHGRSPTCGDQSGASHAHVHVAPVGALHLDALNELATVSSSMVAATGSFLAIAENGQRWKILIPKRRVAHLARISAALIANSNGISWRPLAALPDIEVAVRTVTRAREIVQPLICSIDRDTLRTPNRRRGQQLIVVEGPTGAGKTTVGAYLADRYELAAIELGVIIRLLCLHVDRTNEAGDVLWRWARSRRIDFDGQSNRNFAARLPRLDGRSVELPLWTHVEVSRLIEVSRGGHINDVLREIATHTGRASGAVVVGRAPQLEAEGLRTRLYLEASPVERVRRKRALLATVDLDIEAHDWFTPTVPEVPTGATIIDTTNLSIGSMLAAATRHTDSNLGATAAT